MALIFPTSRVKQVVDLFLYGDKEYLSTGLKSVDMLYQIRPGEVSIFTGFPTSGKSAFLRNIRRYLSTNSDQKHLVYGPEEGSLDRQIQKIALNHIGKNRFSYVKMPDHEEMADKLKLIIPSLSRYYGFLDFPDGSPTWEIFKEQVLESHGKFPFNTLTIDPISYIKTPRGIQKSEYLGELLREVNILAKTLNIHAFIVAHPTKPKADKEGKHIRPTAYDIAHTSDFFNNADNVIIMHRTKSEVLFIKEKTKDTGAVGEVKLDFNPKTGWYSEWVEETTETLFGKQNADLAKRNEAIFSKTHDTSKAWDQTTWKPIAIPTVPPVPSYYEPTEALLEVDDPEESDEAPF